MAVPASQQRLTLQEFLSWEREQENRHEFVSGEVVAMAGGSPAHALVAGNVLGTIFSANGPCRGYTADLKVGIEESLFYPDITVVCGPLQTLDGTTDVCVNPKVIFEVISPTTEQRDRGQKFEAYRSIDSLKDFLLVSQDKPQVEHYTRQSDGTWLFRAYVGMEADFEITALGTKLRMADVFRGVDFAGPEPEQQGSG